MSDRSVIIIGAGLAGLSAGYYAQANNYDSTIIEHHSKPGGAAAAWMRRDYLIDGGIHFISGHKPGTALNRIYQELGVSLEGRVAPMTTYFRYIDEEGGLTIDVTDDLDSLASELTRLSPMDGGKINKLVGSAKDLQELDFTDLGMDRPPELTGFIDKLKTAWRMRGMARFMLGDLSKSIEDYTLGLHQPWLGDLLKNLFLPQVPAWFVSMLLASFADGQMGLLKGGCRDLVLPLERRFNGMGDDLSINTEA